MTDEVEKSAEEIAQLFAKADASVVTDLYNLPEKEQGNTSIDIKDVTDGFLKITEKATDDELALAYEKFVKYDGDDERLFEELSRIDPNLTIINRCSEAFSRVRENQKREFNKLFEESGYKRYETKESLPTQIELQSFVIYPITESDSFIMEGTPWITSNTTKDFTTEKDEPFIQPVTTGSWLTKHARSILVKTGTGYRQIKGSGNPDKPNFPPRVNATTTDQGHEVLWAVSKEEAVRSIQSTKLLKEYNVPHTEIVRVVKLAEVPVPINKDGGVEIRPFVEAYTKEWEHSDHVRRLEIQRMKQRLIANGHISTEDKLDNEDIVNTFFIKEGFYQIHSEKEVPFKNSIPMLMEAPILLDYLAGEKKTSLDSQADKIKWVAREIGRAYKIDELESLELPDDINLDDYKQEIIVYEGEKRTKGTKKQDNVKHVNFRHMSTVYKDTMSERNAKSLRTHFGLEPNSKIYQLDGMRLYSDIIATLSPESKKQLEIALTNSQESLVKGYVNSTLSGVGLSQSIDAKDSILGSVSDYWLVGSYAGIAEIEDSVAIQSLKEHEQSVLGSLEMLELLKGQTEPDYQYKIKHEQMIAEQTLTKKLNITFGIKEKREKLKDKLLSLKEKYLELREKSRNALTQNDSASLQSRLEEMDKFPILLKYLSI